MATLGRKHAKKRRRKRGRNRRGAKVEHPHINRSSSRESARQDLLNKARGAEIEIGKYDGLIKKRKNKIRFLRILAAVFLALCLVFLVVTVAIERDFGKWAFFSVFSLSASFACWQNSRDRVKDRELTEWEKTRAHRQKFFEDTEMAIEQFDRADRLKA